jgi:hypothetical protein
MDPAVYITNPTNVFQYSISPYHQLSSPYHRHAKGSTPFPARPNIPCTFFSILNPFADVCPNSCGYFLAPMKFLAYSLKGVSSSCHHCCACCGLDPCALSPALFTDEKRSSWLCARCLGSAVAAERDAGCCPIRFDPAAADRTAGFCTTCLAGAAAAVRNCDADSTCCGAEMGTDFG